MEYDILSGLRGVMMAPITRDDKSGYECGEAVALSGAIGFNITNSVESSRALYSDDGIAIHLNLANGMTAYLRLAGVDPAALSRLGLVTFDDTKSLIGPGLIRCGRPYSIRFTIDGTYGRKYCHMYRIFFVESVRIDQYSTRKYDDNGEFAISECVITGSLREPVCARYPMWETTIINDNDVGK